MAIWVDPTAFDNGDPLTLVLANQLMVDNAQFLYDNLGVLDAKAGYIAPLVTPSNFSLLNIPQGYDSLHVVAYLRSTYTGATQDFGIIRFNGDTAANYAYNLTRATTTTLSSTGGGGQASLFGAGLEIQSSHATPGALAYSVLELTIPGYSNNSYYKAVTMQSGCYKGAAGGSHYNVSGHATWLQTAPIDRIDISANGGLWEVGSYCAVFAGQHIS
ncbi:MAG: hypothetical protein KF821_08990 [Anaerolineales bacterium]|nr:hypothetical protein [Anaerolineales bacterium]